MTTTTQTDIDSILTTITLDSRPVGDEGTINFTVSDCGRYVRFRAPQTEFVYEAESVEDELEALRGREYVSRGVLCLDGVTAYQQWCDDWAPNEVALDPEVEAAFAVTDYTADEFVHDSDDLDDLVDRLRLIEGVVRDIANVKIGEVVDLTSLPTFETWEATVPEDKLDIFSYDDGRVIVQDNGETGFEIVARDDAFAVALPR